VSLSAFGCDSQRIFQQGFDGFIQAGALLSGFFSEERIERFVEIMDGD
jgi:hypothetical protein